MRFNNDAWRNALRHDVAEAVRPLVCKPATPELQREFDDAVRRVWTGFVKQALAEVQDVIGIEQRKAQRAAGYAIVPDETMARVLGADGHPVPAQDFGQSALRLMEDEQ